MGPTLENQQVPLLDKGPVGAGPQVKEDVEEVGCLEADRADHLEPVRDDVKDQPVRAAHRGSARPKFRLAVGHAARTRRPRRSVS